MICLSQGLCKGFWGTGSRSYWHFPAWQDVLRKNSTIWVKLVESLPPWQKPILILMALCGG